MKIEVGKLFIYFFFISSEVKGNKNARGWFGLERRRKDEIKEDCIVCNDRLYLIYSSCPQVSANVT